MPASALPSSGSPLQPGQPRGLVPLLRRAFQPRCQPCCPPPGAFPDLNSPFALWSPEVHREPTAALTTSVPRELPLILPHGGHALSLSWGSRTMPHRAGEAPVLLAHLPASRWGSAAPDDAPLPPARRFPRASATPGAIRPHRGHPSSTVLLPLLLPSGTGRRPARRYSLKPLGTLLPLQGPAADSLSSKKLQLHNCSAEAG